MKKNEIKCSECEFCRAHRKFGTIREGYTCIHPDAEYVAKYFREHKIKKMPCFIGYGKGFMGEVPVKTSPAWCPKKKKSEG